MKLPGLKYGSPCTFSFSQKIQLAILPPVVAYALRALYLLNRVEVRHGEYYEELLAREGHGILAFWHECMGLAACHHCARNFHGLTSYSFDGEMAARVINWQGSEAVRGSSSKGGSIGLHELEKALEFVAIVGLTLDGPRGPRRVAKPGEAILAARSGVSILPNAYALTRAWRLHSWDRCAIPKPFGRIICAYGEPIPPPVSDAPDEVEKTRRLLEERLNALHAEIELELGGHQEFDGAAS